MPAARPRILLGVTGSIAAYKTPQLVRDLLRAGMDVRVAMTRSAAAFVTPLTLATVSKNAVVIDPLPTDAGAENAGTWHIDLAHWADLMLVAPASANSIAKFVHGRADNAVAMLALALPTQLVVAPAMDDDMWHHAATKSNLAALRARGVAVIDPASGSLASGRVGEGRLPEPETIIANVQRILKRKTSLSGKKILVTAGPTQEAIDPVRYIGNRSSGKMGFAIAEEAQSRGARVTLIAGPTSLPTPNGVERVDVESADQMLRAVQKSVKTSNVVIMAAAVADYTPVKRSTSKIKKSGAGLELVLKPMVDILASIGKSKGKRVHIGFALETDNGLANAKKKLREKNLDYVILNAATGSAVGIGGDENTITVVGKTGSPAKHRRMSKRECAAVIVGLI